MIGTMARDSDKGLPDHEEDDMDCGRQEGGDSDKQEDEVIFIETKW